MRNHHLHQSVGAHGRAPLRRQPLIFRTLLLALLMLATVISWGVSAQDEPAVFNDFQPKLITSGQTTTLSIFGANFPPNTAVALKDVGLLPTTVVNTNALAATLPTNLAARGHLADLLSGYQVLVIVPGQEPMLCADTACLDKSGNPLTLIVLPAPLPTSIPQPTMEPIIPTIAPPPTIAPGAPSLLIRSFTANPSIVVPGGTVTFNVEIVNVGTRAAEGLSVSVDSGGKFIPANGQATLLLPNIAPNSGTVVGIPVTAAEDTPPGPQGVPITMTYRDFTGDSYSAKGSLTVTVEKVDTATQITLARYLFDPTPAEPGKAVKVTILLTNTGNAEAKQVLVRIGEGGLLLAGPQGDSFPVGDLKAGTSASVEMPLIVSAGAKPGPQPQGFSINYLQDGEAKQFTSSVTLDVAKVVPTSPVLLLDEFDVGKAFLQPGEQFTAKVTLKNVGKESAENMLVTFGTVSPGSGSSGNDNDSGTGTTPNTNPSTTFAPMGSGGTIFAGILEADGGTTTLEQDFIVNGSVDTGIYTLPITLRYQKADGTTVTDTLTASLVVVLPPRLSLELQSPLPTETNLGEPLFLTLGITNRGRKAVNFNTAAVTTDNGEVIEGAETFLGPLRADDDTSISTNVMPSEEGAMKVTISLNYTDDLNKPQTIVKEYDVQVVEPPPLPTFEPPPDTGQPTTGEEEEQTNTDDLLGRLLLGLLGLGS